MKRIVTIILLTLSCLAAKGQDSLAVAAMDSTLIGREIISVLGNGIKLNQTVSVNTALHKYIQANSEKQLSGYRIRVFYDNSPQARTRSESIAAYLNAQYPGTRVYRSFESPNYKVTVGDYRTKDEALKLFMVLKNTYPTAFIIKENINYPM